MSKDNYKYKMLWAAAAAAVALVIMIVLSRDRVDGGAPAHDAEASRSAQASEPPLGSASSPRPPAFDLGSTTRATISGTIHDPSDRPIAGASVCALANSERLQGFGERTRRCVRSGSDGHYRIEGLWPVETSVDASAPNFKPGRWQRSERRGRGRNELPLRAGQLVDGVDIELEPGGVLIHGVVRDIAGGEIEGAQVWARGGWRSPERAVAVTISGDQGQFELWVAPGQIHVFAAAEAYAEGWVFAVAPGEFVELFMTPASVLVGEVVLAGTGAPVEGAVVLVETPAGDDRRARTDAAGHFRMDGLEPGTYKPSARTEELYGQTAEQVHLGFGETSTQILIPVHPAFYIEGMAMVAGAKRPCTSGVVELAGAGSNNERGELDEEGQVAFRGVVPGQYEVSVTCEGHVSRAEYPELSVVDHNIGGLLWEVDEGLAIRGEVVDEAGEPVDFAELRAVALADPKAKANGTPTEHSEGDGSFEFAGLLPGRYELSVGGWRSRPGPREPTIVELPGGADVEGVRIVMPALGVVRGRVLDETGAAVSGASLDATLVGGTGSGASRSDDAGKFEIVDLRPGPTRVTAADSPFAWSRSWMRKPGTSDDDLQGEVVEVVANEVVEVELVVESRGGKISGVVTDEGGGPVADAFVDADRMSDRAGSSAALSRAKLRWSWDSQPVLTDQDGHFELSGLAEGEFIVRANREGGGEAMVEGVAPGSHVALVIASTGELAGTVEDNHGHAPERFTVVVEDKGGGVRLQDSFFRTDGVWHLRELPPGSFQISANAAEGTVTLDHVIELGEGEVHGGVELQLAPRLTLRGRLVDLETRAPVPGLEVIAFSGGNFMSNNGAGEPGLSGADGRFVVEEVPSGQVYVAAIDRAASSSGRRYDPQWKSLRLGGEPSEQDIGDLELIARGLAPNQDAGDLGYDINDWDVKAKPEELEVVVASVRPGGPAVGTGLTPGDVIEKVQGHDVLGVNRGRYNHLSVRPAGTTLRLEIRGGKQVEIIVGPAI